MKKHFLSFWYIQTLYQRIHTLRQGEWTIDKYTDDFYQLVGMNDMLKTEKQVISIYLNGLWQSIQDVLCLQSLYIVCEAYQKALIVEK
jgi:hypothetical protein